MEVAVLHKNDAEITIREVAVGDENALLAFYRGLEPGAAYFFTPWPFTHRAMAAHVREVVAGRAIGWVAVGPDRAIVGHGFIKAVSLGGWRRWLRPWRSSAVRPRLGIGLAASARGHGVGRLVMDRLLQDARARGVRVIRLGVHKSNESALHLYGRFGFQVIAAVSQQEPDDSVEMEVRLGP